MQESTGKSEDTYSRANESRLTHVLAYDAVLWDDTPNFCRVNCGSCGLAALELPLLRVPHCRIVVTDHIRGRGDREGTSVRPGTVTEEVDLTVFLEFASEVDELLGSFLCGRRRTLATLRNSALKLADLVVCLTQSVLQIANTKLQLGRVLTDR